MNNSKHDVLKEILSISWIYEKVFWNLLEKLVYDNKEKSCKRLLKHVYWFEDVDVIFDSVIENRKFNYLSKIIFHFYENENNSILKSNNEWKTN